MAMDGLGGFIRTRREARKQSLRAFADQLGISAAHESDIEHNRRKPSAELMAKMAEALEVDLEDLQALDARLSADLKKWMDENPKVVRMLEEVRSSGRSVEDLLVAWRKAKPRPR
jgi:transcriptional regulator with XRE-family HTH domain